MTHIYTAVGSRTAPLDIQRLACKIAYVLYKLGYTQRSGAAPGMDSSFESGVTDIEDWDPDRLEIYLPWPVFEQRPNHQPYYVASRLPNYHAAEAIAVEIHPVWSHLSQGPRKLHTRNVYQVLGKRLIDPSEFLICWAQTTTNGQVKGGTATAVALAKQFRIPVYNLYVEEDLNRLMDVLQYLLENIPNDLPNDILMVKEPHDS